MKLLIHVVFILALLLPLSAHAEIKTITHTVQQPFGGSQSPDDARTAGIARAKREALERFGTYIESRTVVKDAQVDSDEILALTAGVTKAEVLKQKNYTDGDGFGLEITVKVELDTSVLDQSLKRLLQDRNHLKDLSAARVREKQLLARIAELERQNQQKQLTAAQSEALKQEFNKANQGLTAVEWFYKAMALWDGNKYSDLKMAINYFSQAIKIDPSIATAYNNRGSAYLSLKQYQQAISDYTLAIQLNPGYSDAYYNRGCVYSDLSQYDQAISDYTTGIQLNPSDASAYYNRGLAHTALKQYHQAINDYTQTIKLDPKDANAYTMRGRAYAEIEQPLQAINEYTQAIKLAPSDTKNYNNRGLAYSNIKQFQRAIKDYTQAIRLDSSNSAAYNNRGNAYIKLKQYRQAIDDYTKSIKHDPGYAAAYNNRGLAFFYLKNTRQSCKDLSKACTLGLCDAYEAQRIIGVCK